MTFGTRHLTAGLLSLALGAAAPAFTHAPLAAQTAGAGTTATMAPAVPEALKPLFEGIVLSDRQIQGVLDVHNKFHMAIGAPAAQTARDSVAMSAGATDARLDEAKELRAVLTPDQQKVFDKNLETAKTNWSKPKAY